MKDDDRIDRTETGAGATSGLGKTFQVLAAAAAGFLLVLVYGLANGSAVKAFAEGRPGTYLSMALLLATGFVNFRIRRQRLGSGAPAGATLIWLLIGAGFVFLALDEALQVHEKLDELIHSIGGFDETAVTDRIDDVIILAYGLIGLGALVAWRREITGIRGLVRFLACGLVLMGLQVALDALSNGDDVMLWLGVSEQSAPKVSDAFALAEDAAKIAAEAVLLAGFLHALRILRARPAIG